MACPACGEVALDDLARFCIGCGAALPAGVITTAPPRIAPPPTHAEPDPLVPSWVVAAGVLVLLGLLAVLLLLA